MSKVQCPDCHCVFYSEPPASRFLPPKVEEVAAYCKSRGNAVDPQGFIDHYEAGGWVRGKTKIKDWRACVRTWEKNTKIKESIAGAECPLCGTYRLVGNSIVCASCGPYCRKCGEGTARLKVVRRKDGTKSAMCGKCLDEIWGR